MESNSVFVQPLLLKKLGLKIKIHFLHSFKPFSIEVLRLSPIFKENSSYQTGHHSLCNSSARGFATSSLSLLSWQINPFGISSKILLSLYLVERNCKLQVLVFANS